MLANLQAKSAPKRIAKKIASGRMTRARGLLVGFTATCVAALIGASLWITIDAMIEKVKLAHGTDQIIDIVELSRRSANIGNGLGATDHEDILQRLARMSQLKVTAESGGFKAVINPWNGTLIAYALPNGFFRMETLVPPHICERMIGLLAKNIGPLGLRQIDVKGDSASWRQIYAGSDAHQPNKDDVAAGCRSTRPDLIALTFSLR